MAATHLLLCFILWLSIPEVCLQRFYVTEEGRTMTSSCPSHDSYTQRGWSWYVTPLRSWVGGTSIYHQESGGRVITGGAAQHGMSIDPIDFSLTIDSLQMEDTGRLLCLVHTGEQYLLGHTRLVVYRRWLEVRYYSNITLHCSVAAGDYTTRQWYTSPEIQLPKFIYYQNASGVTRGGQARGRSDISLDTDTFQLTIRTVNWGDDTFTCSVTKQQTTNVDITFLAIYSAVFEAEENTSVTLPCDGVQNWPDHSRGHYTRTWQRVNGDLLYYQYLYNNSFYEHQSDKRDDISLNNETFSLTIGKAQLEDDTMFVCTYGEGPTKSVKLIIHTNPKIILSGLDDTPVSVGSTVTVTCTIDRVYPELEPDAFIMRWGTQTIVSTRGTQNNDKSYRYSVQTTHTVTNGHNGTVVECLVNPMRGQSDATSKTIVINAQNNIPSLSPPISSNTSEVPISVPGALSLLEIGGVIAAAVVVIIIIIVITACVCMRKKARTNKVIAQTRIAAESQRRHQLDLPDLSSHDELYLPGANYHEYEEISAQGHGPTDYRQYEALQTRLNANTPIDKWFKEKGMSQSIVKKLKRHKIATIQDLQDMSCEDMVEAGLKVGERNKMKRVLGDNAISRF